MADRATNRATERAAREAYGRLVALLTARTGDVAAAEDALADAFVAALERWTDDAIPDRPEAWLLTVARRRQIDGVRRSETRTRALPDLVQLAETPPDERVPDRRLQLMMMCAHPSIAASVRAPLMLQTVLGLDAKTIGQAFLVSPAAMGQRLSRAKQKIRDAAVPFELSDPRQQPERIAVTCEAVYAAFSTGSSPDADSSRRGLADEAVWLGRLLHEVSGRDPETGGLLALMLHVEARRPAQRDQAGAFVPLDAQDPRDWDAAMIHEAEALLREASRADAPGRFQLEAAIASVHSHRALSGHTDWTAIVALYERLLEHWPSLGARVAHISACAELHGAEAAYARLLDLPPDRVARHQAYWTLRAHLERETGRPHRESLEKAASMTEDAAVQAYLLGRSSATR